MWNTIALVQNEAENTITIYLNGQLYGSKSGNQTLSTISKF
jgi:hypothetical protein